MCSTCDTLQARVEELEAWVDDLSKAGAEKDAELVRRFDVSETLRAELQRARERQETWARAVKTLHARLEPWSTGTPWEPDLDAFAAALSSTPPRGLCTKCGKGHSDPGWCEAEEATQLQVASECVHMERDFSGMRCMRCGATLPTPPQEFVQSLAPPSTAPPQGPECACRMCRAILEAGKTHRAMLGLSDAPACGYEDSPATPQEPERSMGPTLAESHAEMLEYARAISALGAESERCLTEYATTLDTAPACEVCGRSKGHE